MTRGPYAVLAAVLALLALAAPGAARAADRPQARAVDGVAGVAALFDRFPLVGIGENHGDTDQHAFLRRLVSDPRVLAKVDVIVIEAGSAGHQGTVDRYIAGGDVSDRALAQSWRDSVGGGTLTTWDSPVYKQFLQTVRDVNRGRPADDRVRVVLGDPPVPWTDIRRKGDVEKYLEQRETHFASVVDREVLQENKRALLISGVLHLLRDPAAPNRSAAELIDRAHPGKLFLVTLPAFDPAADFAGFEYTRQWRPHSLVEIDGTDIGALRRPRPPGAPQAPVEEESADAWLTLTPNSRFSNPYPTSFDDAWLKELIRRVELDFGPFRADQWFHVDCQFGDVSGRGLPLASRELGTAGDPRPEGAAARGGAPRAADAGLEIIRQLRARKIVAVGETGGLQQLHGLLRTVLVSRPMRSLNPVIVVSFGNSRHQRTLDRYLRGARVPAARLARVWQDTSQLLAYERDQYRQFFAAVRQANVGRPAARRLRVLLGEPPLNWKTATRADVNAAARGRAAFAARLLRRYATSRRRGALLVAERDLVARVPGSVTARFPTRRTWVVEPYTGFASAQDELERRLGDIEPQTALTVRGSWLAGLRAGRNIAGARPASRLGDAVDALLYLGPTAALTVSGPLPTLFRDRYVAEVGRRHRVLFGTRLDPARAFPTSECRAPVEAIGGPPGGSPQPTPGTPGQAPEPSPPGQAPAPGEAGT